MASSPSNKPTGISLETQETKTIDISPSQENGNKPSQISLETQDRKPGDTYQGPKNEPAGMGVTSGNEQSHVSLETAQTKDDSTPQSSENDSDSIQADEVAISQTEALTTSGQSQTSTVSTPTSTQAPAPEAALTRLVLVGKTGNGKSSLGNVLLGRHSDLFPIGRGMSSTTTDTTVKTNTAGKLEIVDTPDLVNCDMSGRAETEVGMWKTMTPDSVGVVVVIRCDVRYTAEEYAIYRQVKELWGEGFCKHLVVAFTFADSIDLDREKFKQELQTVCQELQNVLLDASHRYEIFDCSSGKYDEKVHKGSINNLLDLLRRDEQPGAPGITDWEKKTVPNSLFSRILQNIPFLGGTASTSEVGGGVGGSWPAQVTPKT